MALPEFNADGDLPPGIYRLTLPEVLAQLGQGTIQRRAVAERLARIYALGLRTGHLARFIVFGSFVTAKEAPNDVDVVLIMDDEFDVAAVIGEAAIVFRHDEAEAHLGASVFWVRRSAALGGEQAMIEYWQVRRDGGQRGIVEVLPEKP
ncbi:MAG TPA: hypothetical protein VKB78_11610 [Pirellulales bacterium]|nr:hypothetical protein [Pirellulales bacterium]